MLKNKLTKLWVVILPILIIIANHFNPYILYKPALEFGIVIFVSVLSVLYVFSSKKLSKIVLIILILITIFNLISNVISANNLNHIFSSVNSFKNFILDSKQYGVVTLFFIQFLQVVAIPVPSIIITLTSVVIYGPIWGALICTLGVVLGSITSFLIGKYFGLKIVSWVVGEEKSKKYANMLNSNGKIFLVFAFLFPLFPDDVLCLVAGLSSIKTKDFILITLFTRPFGVFCLSFFGSGNIIPFSGWGLVAWSVILIFVIVLMFVFIKNKKTIENKVVKMFAKKGY